MCEGSAGLNLGSYPVNASSKLLLLRLGCRLIGILLGY